MIQAPGVRPARMIAYLLLASVAASPIHAFAQSAPEQAAKADAEGLADIVVTARKTEERLQDVPVAVTALASE